MNNGPLISVIIPIFNAEKYIKKCLNSITKQSLNQIEIICINDGSNDNTLNILKKYLTHGKLLQKSIFHLQKIKLKKNLDHITTILI